jgi:hypothetical protein
MCPNTYCKTCLEAAGLDWDATIQIVAWGCPVCRKVCCCSRPKDAECPSTTHVHCYTYRTRQRKDKAV